MRRRFTQAAILVVVVFAAAQLVRPEAANPATDASLTIQAHLGSASGLVRVLDRACGECHSNATVWPWYAQIAPMSWVLAQAVKEGRKAVNFSEWGSYSLGQQRDLLAASCQDASEGRMPGAYTLVRHDARLSDEDIATICAAARGGDSSRAERH